MPQVVPLPGYHGQCSGTDPTQHCCATSGTKYLGAGMWGLTAKIARIVFSEDQGDAENTRRADFCIARSAMCQGYPHLRASQLYPSQGT